MSNFPASADVFPSLASTEFLGAAGTIGLAQLLTDLGDSAEALEAKVGTGASTPAANTLLRGTGAGTSVWGGLTSAQLAAILSDETGSGAAVFGTGPTITGATLSGPTISTPTISTPTISGAITGNNIVSSDNVSAGMVVQMVSQSFSAVATGTTALPFDDTIPQNTEGTQFMTLPITPKYSTSTLKIEVVAWLGASVVENITVALFQDSAANALVATEHTLSGNTYSSTIPLLHTMTAGTTSATTFKIRAGGDLGSTLTFNGTGGLRRLSTTPKSYMIITEIKG